MSAKIKLGALYEIHWLDACFYMHKDEIDEGAFKRGGEPIILTGYIIAQNSKAILVCNEMDAEREPHRDFNLIPSRLITKLKRIK